MKLNKKCHCYFHGGNLEGVCDTDCRWHIKGLRCCMEMPREKWGTKEDKKFLAELNKEFKEKKLKEGKDELE